MHCAAHNENSSVAQLLLAKGAAVNATDGEGRMPLHWAALLGRSSVAELLLAMNATVDAEDREGGEPWVGGGRFGIFIWAGCRCWKDGRYQGSKQIYIKLPNLWRVH